MFWLCDKILLRGEFKRLYLEAQNAFQNGTNVVESKEKLTNLLNHAVNTTKFYAPYKGIQDIKEFPIVNKFDYQRQWNDFVSANYAQDKRCHTECTSGSTGMPLEILYDQRKTRKRMATSIFLNSLADYEIGERQLFLRVWVSCVQPSFLRSQAMNLIPWDTSNLDADHLRAICGALARKRVRAITGYASSIETLSRYIQENGIDCSKFKVKSITTISEPLSESLRKQVQEQFSCTVCAVYGAEEFGTVAVQLKDSECYYADTSGMFFEVLKFDEDVPAAEGEPGRLVVTDLYNYAFPIIRYDNGDTVVLQTIHLPKGSYLQYFNQIYGRRSDLIYGTDGTLRSPYLITNNMWRIENVTQWKFVQTGKTTYKFILNGDQSKINEEHIRSLFLESLGKDAAISFEYVDEIPVMNSGKRKYIENQYRRADSCHAG